MRRTLPFLIPILLLPACDTHKNDTPVAERTDSAGVEIVLTRGPDRALEWAFERETTIATDETGPAGVFNPNDAVVRADSAGQLYIMDGEGSRVLVFDAKGALVRQMGRRGGGPGEVGHPISMTVGADGSVGMWDITKRKLVRFAPNGDVLPEVQLGQGFFGGYIHSHGDTFIHDFGSYSPTGGESGLFRLAGAAGAPLVKSPSPPMKPIELKSCGMGFSGMPQIFAPGYRWAGLGDRIAIAREADYDIRIYENDREAKRYRRDLALRAATPELAKQEIGEGMKVRAEGGVRTCDAAEVVEQRGFAPTIPAVGKMAFSPSGELWVQRGGAKGEQLPIDIFAADGTYVGTLPAGQAFPAAFVSADRVAVVERDELDVARVAIYRVRRS